MRPFAVPVSRFAALLLIPISGSIGFRIGTFAPPPSTLPSVPANVSQTAEPIASQSSELPLSERFKAARSASDPLEVAAGLVAIIDQLSLADFRQVAADTDVLGSVEAWSISPAFANGFFDAVVARWLELDAAAGPTIFKCGATENGLGFALARHSPEIVLAQPIPERGRDGFHYTALDFLAGRDRAAAGRAVQRWPEEAQASVRDYLHHSIAHQDPLEGVRIARELNDPSIYNAALEAATSFGRDTVRAVLDAGKGHFGRDTVASVRLRFPELFPEKTDEPVTVCERGMAGTAMILEARRMPSATRQALLDNLEQTPAETRSVLVTAVLRAWQLEDPPAAMEWAWNHEPLLRVKEPSPYIADPAPDPIGTILSGWAAEDWDAAVGWLLRQPKSDLLAAQRGQLAMQLIRTGQVTRALEVIDLTNEATADEPISGIIRKLAEQDPKRAIEVFATLPEWARANTVQQLVTNLSESNPGVAADWLEQQPAGRLRDQGIAAFAATTVRRDSAAAAEWVTRIEDRASREGAAERSFAALHGDFPQQARTWLRSLPGIRPERVESFIRTFPIH